MIVGQIVDEIGNSSTIAVRRRLRTSGLCMLAIAALLPQAVRAGIFEDATAAFYRNDMETVIRTLQSSADRGDAKAQHMIANAYFWRQNYVEAAKWCRLAAEQGDPAAQMDFGTSYELGQGVPKDYIESYKWLNLAAAAGDRVVSKWAAGERANVEHYMTPGQVAEAQRLSREWLLRHTE